MLNQGKYIRELPLKAKMDLSKPMPTPMNLDVSLLTYIGDTFENTSFYQSIAWGLQYAIITILDIIFAVYKVY